MVMRTSSEGKLRHARGTLFARVGYWVPTKGGPPMLVGRELRAPEDTSSVTLTEEWEVRSWCQGFSVGEDELRACLVEVGPRTEDIERRLRVAAKKSFWNDGED